MNDQSKNMNTASTPVKDAIRDPIPGTPGAHPVGAGSGAAVAAVAAPVGAVHAASTGTAASHAVAKATTETVNATVEAKYWLDSHSSRPYATPAVRYEEYAPAYRYGWESFSRRGQGQTFDSVEAELGRGWDHAKGASSLAWDKAKAAARDAWDRVQLAVRGPSHA
jgi:hypothetical protein